MGPPRPQRGDQRGERRCGSAGPAGVQDDRADAVVAGSGDTGHGKVDGLPLEILVIHRHREHGALGALRRIDDLRNTGLRTHDRGVAGPEVELLRHELLEPGLGRASLVVRCRRGAPGQHQQRYHRGRGDARCHPSPSSIVLPSAAHWRAVDHGDSFRGVSAGEFVDPARSHPQGPLRAADDSYEPDEQIDVEWELDG